MSCQLPFSNFSSVVQDAVQIQGQEDGNLKCNTSLQASKVSQLKLGLPPCVQGFHAPHNQMIKPNAEQFLLQWFFSF